MYHLVLWVAKVAFLVLSVMHVWLHYHARDEADAYIIRLRMWSDVLFRLCAGVFLVTTFTPFGKRRTVCIPSNMHMLMSTIGVLLMLTAPWKDVLVLGAT